MAGRRHGRGEGSIYRRKDGRWVGQYQVDGKRRYVYGRIRKEVAERLSKAIAERDAALAFDSKKLSLAEYLDRWLDTIRGTLAPNTVRRHEELTRIHIKPALGKMKLSKLDPLQVQSLYRSKLDEGLSAAKVVKIYSKLSKSLKQAVRWRLIPLNVCYPTACSESLVILIKYGCPSPEATHSLPVIIYCCDCSDRCLSFTLPATDAGPAMPSYRSRTCA